MSQVTTLAPAASSQNDAVIRTALDLVPLYAKACPEQRAALERDCAGCLADGMALEEYTAALADWANAADYLADVAGAQADTDDSTPSQEQAPVPTSTLVEANKTLARFGAECRSQADANYRLAELAADYVSCFLGASPGKAQRSTAVECLGDEWRKWDEESMAQPVSKAMTRLRERVNVLLRCHAVATLLGDGRGVAKGDGTRKGRGKGAKDARLPWGTFRELAPLVYREESNHAETWHVLPSVADEARALVAEIAASGMSRADVVAAVAQLMLTDSKLEHAAAVQSGDTNRVRQAEGAMERWDEKVERTADKGDSKGKHKPAPAPTAEQDDEDAEEIDAPTPQLPAESRQGQNLLLAAREGTAKDVAGMAVELVTGGDEPDDVLEHLLRTLDGHKDLCPASHRAIKAALLILERAARPPQDKPSVNGTSHAA